MSFGVIMKVVGGLFLVGLGYTTYAYVWGKPYDFHHLLERHAFQQVRASPQMLTWLGIVENTPLDFHSGRLSDTSLEALANEHARLERARAEVAAWNRDRLSGQRALSHEVALMLYEQGLERASFPYSVAYLGRSTYAIEHMDGPHISLPNFMTKQHRLVNQRSARRYIQRLIAFESAFQGYLERAEMQRQNGVIPPHFVIRNVLSDARAFIEGPPHENILLTHFVDTIDDIASLRADTKAALIADARDAVENHVYPAYRRLIRSFEALERAAEGKNNGVWSFPNGQDYYALMARVETTTDLTPDEIHQIGLEEVARIEAEMDAILRDHGLVEGPVGERVARLGQDPAHQFSNDAEGRAALVAYLEELLADVNARLPDWFGTLPRVPVEVKRVPEYAEAAQTIAYYNPPSLDGERPGVFYINLRDTREMPRWSLPSLTYHEANPGHHLQIALAMEIKGLPILRRMSFITAYVEGWALYTEALVKEMGVYEDDPLGNLGRLQYEMWRAVRLVVDTGIHARGWTREQAIDYFREKTGMTETDARVEIERYFVWPGQALAYKIGMLKIQELRARAEDALGDEFDIRAFHDTVLLNGALPLTLLEKVVDDWIAAQL